MFGKVSKRPFVSDLTETSPNAFNDSSDSRRRNKSDGRTKIQSSNYFCRIADNRHPDWRDEQLYDWGLDGYPVIKSTDEFKRARMDTQPCPVPQPPYRGIHQQQYTSLSRPSHASCSSWTLSLDPKEQRAYVPSNPVEPMPNQWSYLENDGSSDKWLGAEGQQSGYAETISGSNDEEDEAQEDAWVGDRTDQPSERCELECQYGNAEGASKDEEISGFGRSDVAARWRALDEREAHLTTLEFHLASKARNLETDREKLASERQAFETRVQTVNEQRFSRGASGYTTRGGPLHPSTYPIPQLDYSSHENIFNDNWDVHLGNEYDYVDTSYVGEHRNMYAYEHTRPSWY